MALGDVSSVVLDAARNAARQAAGEVTIGQNPSLERKKRRSAGTVLELVEAYLGYARSKQRARSFKETERHLRVHATPLHHERVESVARRQVADLLQKVAALSGPTAANRLRAAVSAMWSWGLRTGLIESDSSPVAFTVRQPEKARDRVLADNELRAIWAATDDASDYSRIVRLCLLTGCRREEIGGMRWSEVQEDRIVIGADRMKGKLAHEIALLPLIASTLPIRPAAHGGQVFGRRGTGFSGYSDGKEKVDGKLRGNGVELPPWGLHDLRRTFSTRLHEDGIEPLVIEALLAHKQQGVAAVYNRASFRAAKKAALERWHEILCSACAINAQAPPSSQP
jgi:integrase